MSTDQRMSERNAGGQHICGTFVRTGCEQPITCEECMCCEKHCKGHGEQAVQECPKTKVLRKLAETLRVCQLRVERHSLVAVEITEAAKSPCSCAGMREQLERMSAGVLDIAQHGLGLPDVPEDGAISERVFQLRQEHDRLREENEKLQGKLEISIKEKEYSENQLANALEQIRLLAEADRHSRELLATRTEELVKSSEEILKLRRGLEWTIAEKHGAQADAEREKNTADSLRSQLAASKAREEGITRQYQKSMELLAAARLRAEEGFRLGLDAGRAESKEREEKLAEALDDIASASPYSGEAEAARNALREYRAAKEQR